MKRLTKSKRAQRDLMAALGVLRQLTKEVGGNYLASLQADVTSVEQCVRQVENGDLSNRRILSQIRAMLRVINALDVKPQRGRRRDLKHIDQVISKIGDMASDW
jgi:hypothetical protein